MKSERLIFPRGVRLLTDANEDLPDQKSRISEEELERIANADIRTGYIVKKNDEKPGFSSFIEANVHAPDIWRVFTRLVQHLLPEKAYPILVYDEEEPWHGPLAPTASILKVAAAFSDAISNDCFIALGVIAYPQGMVEEVFISLVKYLQIWTNQTQVLTSTLRELHYPRVKELQLIDQYPIIRSFQFDRDAGNLSGLEIVNTLKKRFESIDDGTRRGGRLPRWN